MTTLSITSKAGADGVLHLDIPVAQPNEEYEVTLVLKLKKVLPFKVHPNWPPGYFENVIGSVDDETFIRHPQGEPEKRLDFE